MLKIKLVLYDTKFSVTHDTGIRCIKVSSFTANIIVITKHLVMRLLLVFFIFYKVMRNAGKINDNKTEKEFIR